MGIRACAYDNISQTLQRSCHLELLSHGAHESKLPGRWLFFRKGETPPLLTKVAQTLEEQALPRGEKSERGLSPRSFLRLAARFPAEAERTSQSGPALALLETTLPLLPSLLSAPGVRPPSGAS